MNNIHPQKSNGMVTQFFSPFRVATRKQLATQHIGLLCKSITNASLEMRWRYCCFFAIMLEFSKIIGFFEASSCFAFWLPNSTLEDMLGSVWWLLPSMQFERTYFFECFDCCILVLHCIKKEEISNNFFYSFLFALVLFVLFYWIIWNNTNKRAWIISCSFTTISNLVL